MYKIHAMYKVTLGLDNFPMENVKEAQIEMKEK